ncbi:MAG TPA: ROK family protein [Spirochaetia bacterium]|nr:ROK family protein [Spirochaetia bacterium]
MNSYVLGIDIGGTKSAIILGTDSGSIIDRIQFPTEPWNGPDLALKRYAEGIASLLKEKGIHTSSVKAIGVSCGSPLDPKRGLILSPPNLPGWNAVPITEYLKHKTGIDTFLENDANACAIAEWKFGAGKGCEHMIFLTFGTGFGAGLILNGRLYGGARDMAGEIGHVRLSDEGPTGYGKVGSSEAFCSGGGIAQLAQREILRRFQLGETVGFCPAYSDIPSITTKDVGEAAKNGDPVATEILALSGKYLGKALSILMDLFNPERIVIGSVFARLKEFLLPSALSVIEQEVLPISRESCQIVPAALGETIGDVAALSIAIEGVKHGT